MIYLCHICAVLLLTMLMSSVMPYFRISDGFYDLLSVFVIFLGIYRHKKESLPVVLFAGIIMDNLTGGPFGLYITVYLWILFGTGWIMSFLHVKNFFLLPIVVLAGVCIENTILFFAAGMAALEPGFFVKASCVAAEQIFWAVCTGTFFLSFIIYIYRKLDEWQNEFFIKKRGSI